MKCENCLIEIDGTYGSGRFCNRKCACQFVSKQNRDIKNSKIKNSLKKEDICNICSNCNKKFIVRKNKKDQKCCSNSCSQKLKWKDKEYRDKITNHIIERCSTKAEKERLRDIGRKGGFGNKGELHNGIKYSSNFEKECFQFLIDSSIEFIPHKNIPNSSKVSDIYFEKNDLYIELDGINREKRQKWLEKEYKYWKDKLEIYNKEKLNYKIFYSFDEFKNFIIN